ncbi:MAG: SAM-dependent methyltransferase [Candidatus Phosphoribacter sp.]|nr:SAM-dependent methyltransferase [Actinomycetales bacterium]
MTLIPWEQAWQQALYGDGGFYRRRVPARHFATATHPPLGPVLAEAVWRCADLLELSGVVDIGAGRGELIHALHRHRPDRPLTGVDVVTRPHGLPDGVGWLQGPGGAPLPDELTGLRDVLVIAHEWLDVVPCTVAQLDDDGVARVVLVDPQTGIEALGDPLVECDHEWQQRYWPLAAPGDRVEIGLSRDRAWADLLARISHGSAIAIDDGHVLLDRPHGGTLAAYRAGEPVRAVPDGSCDLSARVAMDSLYHDEIHTQTAAFEWFGVRSTVPDLRAARCDEADHRRRVERSGAVATLTDPAGFGAFRWVIVRQPRASAPPQPRGGQG